MWKFFGVLKKKLIIAIPIAMLLGLLVGGTLEVQILRVSILPLTIMMIYPMMVALNFRSVFSSCSIKLQLTTQFINSLLIPLVAFGVGKLFLEELPLQAFGLLLIGLLPTSGMTISWTGFAKGNVKVAVKMTILGLILGALLTPFWGNLLMGKVIPVPILKTFKQIGLIVFLPMILGYLTRLLLIRRYGEAEFNKRLKPRFPLLATLGVLGIIFVAMALKAEGVLTQPEILLKLLLPLLIFYLLCYGLISLAGRLFFSRKDAIALVYGTVMRNLSVALAIALTLFGRDQGSEIALIISIAYIIQVQSAAWYVRLCDRFFGPPKVGIS